ncbi:MAG: hypothetical protein FWE12_07800 [Oscillospiraceae bacterium]|nr:hypothetical protein [Oscillospiraceae bacterium]
MKKKVIFLLVTLALVSFIFVACRNNPVSRCPTLQTYPALEQVVTMTVTDINASVVTVSIQNNSDFPLITGLPFELDVYDQGVWRRVMPHEGWGFLAIGLPIAPRESFEMPKDLQAYLPLEPGLYRIRKDVFIDTWRAGPFTNGQPRPSTETSHEIAADFRWA